MKLFPSLTVLAILCIFLACSTNKGQQPGSPKEDIVFDTNHLVVPINNNRVRGQVLYMPVYSSVPYQKEGRGYSLSAFLSVHNTDFNNRIRLTKVLFFNTRGELVKDYQQETRLINPLQTIEFLVPETDTSGFGANFIVEWVADSLVTTPLIETVMIGITNGQGISFLSQGRVLGILK